MWQIIEKCKKLNHGERYLFLSNGLGNGHADPEAQQIFQNLGYKVNRPHMVGEDIPHLWY